MSFGLLFVIVAAGLIGPLLSGSRRVSIPMVVGEIIAGIVIGTSGFKLVDADEPTLKFLASVGFAMLLFVVGTKLPLHDPDLRKALWKGAFASGLSFLVALPIALALAHYTSIHNVGLFLLLCACSSTSTVMPILIEKRLTGKVIVLTTAWVAITDIVTMVLLPLAMESGNPVTIAIGAIVVTVVALGCLFLLKFFRTSNSGGWYRELSKKRGWALDLRLSLAVLFGLAWLATKFGTSVLVAGFAAGMIVALIGMPKRFNKQLIGLAEGLFVPLFFVTLGARLDIWDLFGSMTNIGLALLVCAATTVVHVIAAKLIRLPVAAGLTATVQMGLPAALVSMGLSSGLLTAGQGAALIGAALLTLIICSIGTALLARADGVTIAPDSDKPKPK